MKINIAFAFLCSILLTHAGFGDQSLAATENWPQFREVEAGFRAVERHVFQLHRKG